LMFEEFVFVIVDGNSNLWTGENDVRSHSSLLPRKTELDHH
jgi:hypothetical protein